MLRLDYDFDYLVVIYNVFVQFTFDVPCVLRKIQFQFQF